MNEDLINVEGQTRHPIATPILPPHLRASHSLPPRHPLHPPLDSDLLSAHLPAPDNHTTHPHHHPHCLGPRTLHRDSNRSLNPLPHNLSPLDSALAVLQRRPMFLLTTLLLLRQRRRRHRRHTNLRLTYPICLAAIQAASKTKNRPCRSIRPRLLRLRRGTLRNPVHPPSRR